MNEEFTGRISFLGSYFWRKVPMVVSRSSLSKMMKEQKEGLQWEFNYQVLINDEGWYCTLKVRSALSVDQIYVFTYGVMLWYIHLRCTISRNFLLFEVPPFYVWVIIKSGRSQVPVVCARIAMIQTNYDTILLLHTQYTSNDHHTE